MRIENKRKLDKRAVRFTFDCVSRINGIGRTMQGRFYSRLHPTPFASIPVSIEDQFGCQTSACHLGVFTGARIIHRNPFRNAYKSRDSVATEGKERGGGRPEKVSQEGGGWRGCPVARRKTRRRVKGARVHPSSKRITLHYSKGVQGFSSRGKAREWFELIGPFSPWTTRKSFGDSL